MKSLRNHIGTLAFCLSLLLHGSLSYIMLGVFQRQTARQLYQPPAPRSRQGYVVTAKPLLVPDAAVPPSIPKAEPAPARATTPPPGLALLPPPPAPPAAPALPPAPAPKPLAKLPDIEELPEVNSEFGQHEGKGASMHASPGDKPMLARKGPQDQAWISRDEVGAGNPNNQPSSDGGKLGAPGLIAPDIVKPDPPQPVQVATLTPSPTPTPAPQRPAFGVAAPDQESPQPAPPAPRPRDDGPVAIGPGPLDRPADETRTPVPALPPDTQFALANPAHPLAPARATPAVRTPPAQSTTRPAPANPLANARVREQGDNGTGKPGNTAADPAPMSDSESDAFSTVGAAVFRNGKLEARFGRQVKTVRPRLNLAGQYDLLSLPSPSVVLKVRADETGRVRRVDIVKSSGSNEVDQPCQLAMYEWWFEPAKDKSGKPLPAEMTWTISWR